MSNWNDMHLYIKTNWKTYDLSAYCLITCFDLTGKEIICHKKRVVETAFAYIVYKETFDKKTKA